jgi:hypothetical protein
MWMNAVVIALICVACSDDDPDTGTTSGAGGSGGNGGAGATGGGGGACEGSTSTADCAAYCAGVVAAACPGGPSPEECEQGCGMANGIVAQCPAWGALVDCAESAPGFTCFMGETVPEGCEEELYCFSLCFN